MSRFMAKVAAFGVAALMLLMLCTLPWMLGFFVNVCNVSPDKLTRDDAGRVVAIDLTGLHERVGDGDVQYRGVATRQPNGMWHCIAIVGQSLCRVEISIVLPDGEK